MNLDQINGFAVNILYHDCRHLLIVILTITNCVNGLITYKRMVSTLKEIR